MDDLYNIISKLYDSILKDGLDIYENHVIDIVSVLAKNLYNIKMSRRLYICILEFLNLLSMFDIKNEILMAVIQSFRMSLVEHKTVIDRDRIFDVRCIYSQDFYRSVKDIRM